MVNPHLILTVLIVLGVIWTAGWGFAIAHSGRAVPLEDLARSETRLRLVLLVGLTTIAIGIFVSTLRWLPFQAARQAALGPPQDTVAVTGGQWGWSLSRHRLPVGVPVEFAVTTRDVNHDFAIYDPHGRLLAQVQAMPGYTNRLLYVLPAPGTYTVRCLEYCGLGHHMMATSITVGGH